MANKALVFKGGWNGHQPKEVGDLYASLLKEKGFEVQVHEALDCLNDGAALKELALIVPVWTTGQIEGPQANNLAEAVASGVGLAGCHGGMGDAFRSNTLFQFVVGGQFVGHPGNDGTRYTVLIDDATHFITRGMQDFVVSSEQYYMHVDPANQVLASTEFPVADGPHAANGQVRMPVVWTRLWGKGRVAYHSLGHDLKTMQMPEVTELTVRTCLWAARQEQLLK
jgi:type 1 glutamine amidotransferase